MQNTKDYEEKPIFEVKRRSVISVFVCLLYALGGGAVAVAVLPSTTLFVLSLTALSLLILSSSALLSLFILSVLCLLTVSVQNMTVFGIFSILFLGVCFLYIGIKVLIDILSFKKIAIYDDYVLIKRNFLTRDAKIEISDIEFTYQGASYPVHCITFVVNKRFLKVKDFSVYALCYKNMTEIERIIEEKLKERKGV